MLKPAPHFLRGLNNWLGRLIGFQIFECFLILFYSLQNGVPQMVEEREREPPVDKLLIAYINKAIGILNKSEVR